MATSRSLRRWTTRRLPPPEYARATPSSRWITDRSRDVPVNEAVKDLRGEPGTNVHLRVRRDGAATPVDFDLVRAEIRVNSVRSRMIEPGYGYVRIAQFQHKTPRDLRTAIQRLADKSAGGLLGLIVDLRNNPGGVLGASVDVADEFLDEGLIVYTEGRDAKAEVRLMADDGDILERRPARHSHQSRFRLRRGGGRRRASGSRSGDSGRHEEFRQGFGAVGARA